MQHIYLLLIYMERRKYTKLKGIKIQIAFSLNTDI